MTAFIELVEQDTSAMPVFGLHPSAVMTQHSNGHGTSGWVVVVSNVVVVVTIVVVVVTGSVVAVVSSVVVGTSVVVVGMKQLLVSTMDGQSQIFEIGSKTVPGPQDFTNV